MELLSLLAYIDPGSGNLLLQMLMASVFGALTLFRKSVKRLFSRPKKKNENAGMATSLPAPGPEP